MFYFGLARWTVQNVIRSYLHQEKKHTKKPMSRGIICNFRHQSVICVWMEILTASDPAATTKTTTTATFVWIASRHYHADYIHSKIFCKEPLSSFTRIHQSKPENADIDLMSVTMSVFSSHPPLALITNDHLIGTISPLSKARELPESCKRTSCSPY